MLQPAAGPRGRPGLLTPRADPEPSRKRHRPDEGNPADQGQLAPGARDGRTVLDVGHDVLLDPRRHAGETRVGHLVRSDRGGGAWSGGDNEARAANTGPSWASPARIGVGTSSTRRSADRRSRRPFPRRWLARTRLATAYSHGSASAGTLSIFRQAIVNVSPATSSASAT